jgi:hypothetical protein
MGLFDAIGSALAANALVNELMQLDEVVAMKRLDVIVPRTVREGSYLVFMGAMNVPATDKDRSDDERARARRLFNYVLELRRNL